MNNLLNELSAITPPKLEIIKSAFFEQSDIDTPPSIQELAIRILRWIGERSNEFKETDLETISTLQKLTFKLTRGNERIITFKLTRENERIIPQDLLIFMSADYLKSIQFNTKEAPPLARADTITHSFDQVVKYLPNKELIISQSLSRREPIQRLVDCLDKGEWDTIIFSYKIESDLDLLAYDALGAFYQKKITMEQFSTLIFRWSIEKEFPELEIETMPLFNPDGSINLVCKQYIAQTLSPTGFSSNFSLKHVSCENLDDFYLRMRKTPKSEQYCFYFPTNSFPDSNVNEELFLFKRQFLDQNKITITQEIQKVGMNIFNGFMHFAIKTKTFSPKRMVASLSMMQQMLITFSGDTAVKITPIIGLSSEEDILNNGRLATRDMAIPFPTITLPKKADLLLVPSDLDFWNHDFYHAFLASQIPDAARKAFIELAEVIKKISTALEDKKTEQLFNDFFERMIDMEAPSYRIKNLSESSMFLEMIPFNFTSALVKMRNQNTEIPPLENLPSIFQKIAEELHKTNFWEKLRITLPDLEEFHTSLQNRINCLLREPEYKMKAIELEVILKFISSIKLLLTNPSPS